MNGWPCVGLALVLCSGPACAAEPDETASTGCKLLDHPTLDGIYHGISLARTDFNAGDVILVLATAPNAGIVPTRIRLLVGSDGTGSAVADESQFPGGLRFRVNESGHYTVEWRANIGNAAWQVGCERMALAGARSGAGHQRGLPGSPGTARGP